MTQCQRVWQRLRPVRQWERSPGAGSRPPSGGGGGHLTLPTLLSAEPAPPAPEGSLLPARPPSPTLTLHQFPPVLPSVGPAAATALTMPPKRTPQPDLPAGLPGAATKQPQTCAAYEGHVEETCPWSGVESWRHRPWFLTGS